MSRTCIMITLFIACLVVPGLNAEEAAKVTHHGAVVAVAEDSSSVTISVEAKGKKEASEVTLTLDENTEYVGQIASAADLTEGKKVTIIATGDHADKVTANEGKGEEKGKGKE